MPHIAKIY